MIPVTGSANSPLWGTARAVIPPSWGSKQAMSVIAPTRSRAHRIRTRIPLRTASGPGASSACSSAVSAPSRRTSTQANGVLRGWFGRGTDSRPRW